VSTDKLVRGQGDVPTAQYASRTNAPENLIRLSTFENTVSEAPSNLRNAYRYDIYGGVNQNLYVVDSGVRTDHPSLPSGEVDWTANFITGSSQTDDNGHGTYIAGTLRSEQYGVLPNGQVKSIKVLDSRGDSTISDTTAGVQQAISDHWDPDNAQGVGSGFNAVLQFSIQWPGSGRDPLMEQSLTSASDSGLTTVVAAGNGGQDACSVSPAAAENVITVGGLDGQNRPSTFASGSSNTGECVDIYAPGSNVMTLSLVGDGATSVDGTSFAAPHVAGVVAQLQTHLGDSPLDQQVGIIKQALADMSHEVSQTGPVARGEKHKTYRFLYNGAPHCGCKKAPKSSYKHRI
jgi:subtilisin family serine protease